MVVMRRGLWLIEIQTPKALVGNKTTMKILIGPRNLMLNSDIRHDFGQDGLVILIGANKADEAPNISSFNGYKTQRISNELRVIRSYCLKHMKRMNMHGVIRFGIESSNSMESDISSGDETLTDSTYENFKREKAYKAVPPPTVLIILLRTAIYMKEPPNSTQTHKSSGTLVQGETRPVRNNIQRVNISNFARTLGSFTKENPFIPSADNYKGMGCAAKILELPQAVLSRSMMEVIYPSWIVEDLESHDITIIEVFYTRIPHSHKGPKKMVLKRSGGFLRKVSNVGSLSSTSTNNVQESAIAIQRRSQGLLLIMTVDALNYVEELKFNLLSVSQICDKKHNVLFTDKECLILSPKFKFVDEDLVILRAPRKNDVYSLDLKNIIPSGGITCLVAKATEDEAVLWHRRLGHVNFKNINKLVKSNLVRGLPSKTFKLDHSCVACRKGKQHRASCKKIEERTVREPLELLHMDLFGPVSVESINKKKYCLVVTDDCSKFSWVFFLAYKDETYDMLHDLIVGLENRLRHKVKDHQYAHYSSSKYCNKTTDSDVDTPNSGVSLKSFDAAEGGSSCLQQYLDPTLMKNKRDERGTIIKNKARLVAQGYRQEEGVDYDEVFAPVARIEAIRLFLAFASFMGFTVYQMDVKSAFLYGNITEGVCQQLSRRGAIDKTLFIKKDRRDIMLVQVYVDDIIFGSTKSSMVKDFEDLMQKEFKMSSMGELTFFLGLQVKQSNGGKDEEGEDVDVHLYRSMIGCLMYLTASRPDIMFAVCLCARFQVTPKVSHLHAVKRIFRYLKHQPNLGLWYPKDSPFHLEAFSDSDYAGDNHDRRSTSGGCQYLGRRLVSWQCKKQTIVAISSTEAEYVAAASCCAQVLWMQNQLLDYGFNFMNTEIHIDNESTICIVKNPVFHSKTKHIQIRHHFIRDCYEQRLINVVKVHTDDNVADLLTKGFDLARFKFLVVTIGMMNP
ncbi:putative ribonuclease H-like domain-containing protein [Tanacetum coccineum]